MEEDAAVFRDLSDVMTRALDGVLAMKDSKDRLVRLATVQGFAKTLRRDLKAIEKRAGKLIEEATN